MSYFHIFATKTITYSKLQFCILLLMNIVQQDAPTRLYDVLYYSTLSVFNKPRPSIRSSDGDRSLFIPD